MANWTREEHILAFNLYSKLPFGAQHSRNKRVIELAGLIGRTPGAVAIKLNNFARLDPSLQARGIKGMSHGARGEEEVWAEFETEPEALAFESQRLLAEKLGEPLERVADIDTRDLPAEGREREALVRVRVNQSLFRERILSAYDYTCCVTGLCARNLVEARQLLVASHIVPWSKDPKNRLNPRNGLCLNALHDRAFDRGLMWIDEGYVVRFATEVIAIAQVDSAYQWLVSSAGSRLNVGKALTPSPEFFIEHRSFALMKD